MSAKPGTLPSWDANVANVVTPDSARLNNGWATNDIPPSGFLNWLSYWAAQWLQYLNDGFFVGTSPGGPGLQGTGGAPSSTIAGGDGLVGVGTAGAAGTANGGNGIKGTGATSAGGTPGDGGKFTSAGQSGSAAVRGVLATGAGASDTAIMADASGATNGAALRLKGNATAAPGHIDFNFSPASAGYGSGDFGIDAADGSFDVNTNLGQIKLIGPVTVSPRGTIFTVGGTGVAWGTSWSNPVSYVTRYWIDQLGLVHLEGAFAWAGAGSPFGATVFTLPAAYRPPNQLAWPVGSSANVESVVIVGTNGIVTISNTSTVVNGAQNFFIGHLVYATS